MAEGLLRLGADSTIWVVEWEKDQGRGIRRNSWKFQGLVQILKDDQAF